VDFWDLAKVLVRRWTIAVPMLLLTAGLSMMTFSAVKPDYMATAYVQLVPPVPQIAKPGQPTPPQINPWLGQGLQTLGNAAIVTVQEQSVVETLKASGYTDSFTFEMGGDSPMVKIEAVGKSRAQAAGTADQLVARFTQSIVALQKTERVADVDLIAARRLDHGTNVEKSDSNVKRSLVAVAAAGLMLTVAVTVGFDALVRARARRRSSTVSSVDVATAHEKVVGMAATGVRFGGMNGGHRPIAITTMARPSGGAPPDAESTWSTKQPVVYRSAGQVIEPTDIEAPSTETSAEAQVEAEAAELANVADDDATLILPGHALKNTGKNAATNGAEIPRPSTWLTKE